MDRIKRVIFYSWWLNFWVIMLAIVLLWDRPMLRLIGPMAFIAFIGYAFYATLVTKPAEPVQPQPEEKNESTTTPPTEPTAKS